MPKVPSEIVYGNHTYAAALLQENTQGVAAQLHISEGRPEDRAKWQTIKASGVPVFHLSLSAPTNSLLSWSKDKKLRDKLRHEISEKAGEKKFALTGTLDTRENEHGLAYLLFHSILEDTDLITTWKSHGARFESSGFVATQGAVVNRMSPPHLKKAFSNEVHLLGEKSGLWQHDDLNLAYLMDDEEMDAKLWAKMSGY